MTTIRRSLIGVGIATVVAFAALVAQQGGSGPGGGGGGSGTVTSVATGTGLTGGPITTSGTISVPNAGITNTMLAHASATVNGQTCTLGSSCTTTVYQQTVSAPSGCAASGSTACEIASQSMVASVPAGGAHGYEFYYQGSLVAAGTDCTGNTLVTLTLNFTDPNGATSTNLNSPATVAVGTGTVGYAFTGSLYLVAKSATAISWSVPTYSNGDGCTVYPTYQVFPTLVQIW